jgi:hypothetical protein
MRRPGSSFCPGKISARGRAIARGSPPLDATSPFEEIDLLIVDRLGKNISGSGMDPKRHRTMGAGLLWLASCGRAAAPFIRRILVRDLTPETHGNATGIGLLIVTTTRLVRAIDLRATYINSLTSLALNCAKIPIHFDTDREAIDRTLASLAQPDPGVVAAWFGSPTRFPCSISMCPKRWQKRRASVPISPSWVTCVRCNSMAVATWAD